MKKTKFKVGDKVRVRSDLKIGKSYYSDDRMHQDTFVREMAKHKGTIVTIKKATEEMQKYLIEGGDSWNWTDEMFEPVHTYKVGDKVQIKGDLVVGEIYGGLTLFKDMFENVGKIGTVEKTSEVGNFFVFDWWYSEPMLEPAKVPKKKKVKCKKRVVVETDGETTTATLYEGRKIVQQTKARCMPEDEFDFELGMNLALDRLFAPEDKQTPFELTE